MGKIKTPVSVVIPTYNDQDIAVDRLKAIEQVISPSFAIYEIVILDDGSTDGNADVISSYIKRRPHLRVLKHEKNLGVAQTFHDVYLAAKHPWIVSFSFDWEWDEHDIPRLLQVLETADIVIGQRNKKSYRFGRWFVSTVHNFLNHVFFDIDVYDTQSIKAMRREIIEKIPTISTSVYEEAERIIRAKRLGYRITTVSVQHRMTDKLRNSQPNIHMVYSSLWDMVRVWCALQWE